MHKSGCPQANNPYADCRCDAMAQYDHTEQLRQFNENVSIVSERMSELESGLIESNKDKARLDWLDAATLHKEPESQLVNLSNGPMLDQVTIGVYDGRTTRYFTSPSLRESIDAAMKAGKGGVK